MTALVPPFFHKADAATIESWLKIGMRLPGGRHPATLPLERELLEAWLNLSARTDGTFFDLEAIRREADKLNGKERATAPFGRKLMHRLRVLSHAGVVWRERAAVVGKPRSFIFTLKSPQEVASGWQGDERSSQDNPEATKIGVRQQSFDDDVELQDMVEATYQNLVSKGFLAPLGEVDGHTSNEPWTLSLVSQLIERCSRSSSRDPVDSLESVIRLNGEPVKVRMSRVFHEWEKGNDYGLVAAEDAQLILAIITMAMQNITKDLAAGNNPPRNRVTFDLLELSKLLCPNDGRSAYRAFQKGMARILNTEYVLSPVNPAGRIFHQRFRLAEDAIEGMDDQEIVEGGWEPRSNMRYFSFSLNQHLWKGLLTGHGWLVHQDLLFERHGLVHKLYHHLRSNVGAERPYVVRSDELAVMLNATLGINPRQARKRFAETLRQLLHDRARRDMLFLGDEMPDQLTFRLFDLDVAMVPNERFQGGFTLEARQSPETLALLQRQEAKMRELLQQQQLELPSSPPTKLSLQDARAK